MLQTYAGSARSSKGTERERVTMQERELIRIEEDTDLLLLSKGEGKEECTMIAKMLPCQKELLKGNTEWERRVYISTICKDAVEINEATVVAVLQSNGEISAWNTLISLAEPEETVNQQNVQCKEIKYKNGTTQEMICVVCYKYMKAVLDQEAVLKQKGLLQERTNE